MCRYGLPDIRAWQKCGGGVRRAYSPIANGDIKWTLSGKSVWLATPNILESRTWVNAEGGAFIDSESSGEP
jgi:hypothetical protein